MTPLSILDRLQDRLAKLHGSEYRVVLEVMIAEITDIRDEIRTEKVRSGALVSYKINIKGTPPKEWPTVIGYPIGDFAIRNRGKRKGWGCDHIDSGLGLGVLPSKIAAKAVALELQRVILPNTKPTDIPSILKTKEPTLSEWIKYIVGDHRFISYATYLESKGMDRADLGGLGLTKRSVRRRSPRKSAKKT